LAVTEADGVALDMAEQRTQAAPSAGEEKAPSHESLAALSEKRTKVTQKKAAAADLQIQRGGDGSFSLWSPTFGEGFHSGRGALREARETFLVPSQLERFDPGRRLRVVEVCVGTGTNLAMLLEHCAQLGLELEWWGLEVDPAPLQLALTQAEFRGQWHPQSLETLTALKDQGSWHSPISSGQMLWGDARQTLHPLLEKRRDGVDLVWHDAFSPQHCPQLWTLELLASLAELLNDEGRWISYCSAAALREGLRLAGLNVVALAAPEGARLGVPDSAVGVAAEGMKTAPNPDESSDRVEISDDSLATDPRAHQRRAWSGGTLASRAELPPSAVWRQLTVMEIEHQASSAGEPYRDPTGTATAAVIHSFRREAQIDSLACGERSLRSNWRKRWGV